MTRTRPSSSARSTYVLMSAGSALDPWASDGVEAGVSTSRYVVAAAMSRLCSLGFGGDAPDDPSVDHSGEDAEQGAHADHHQPSPSTCALISRHHPTNGAGAPRLLRHSETPSADASPQRTRPFIWGERETHLSFAVREQAAPWRATPDLSLVIVTHNGRDLALDTLESAMSSVGDAAVEWVIVDSGSTDDTPDAIEERWPGIEVMRLANVGFAAANNAGFAVARGRYLLALNPDTIVRWGRFQAIVEAMDARPERRRGQRHPRGGGWQPAEHPPRPLCAARLVRGAPAAHAAGLRRLQERELDQGAYGEEAARRLGRGRGA